MKISNETKIGALTSIAIVLLILGFNFLKGKSFTNKNTHYYAVFTNIEGLSVGNPVVINGKQVGSVISTDGGKDMRRIVVTVNMNQDVDIPDNSVGTITPSILGTTGFEIKLGSSNTFYKPEDTLITEGSTNLFGDALQKIDPVLAEVTIAVKDMDAVLKSANSMFDPESKNNLKASLSNLNKMTASLAVSSASLQTLLNTQTGALAQSLDNVKKFTGGLASNNDKISDVMTNLQTTTSTLSKLDLQKTVNTLNNTIGQLQTDLGSNNGTLGKLLNDNALYNNLTATTNKLNLLLDDVRVHPKRYINISVFGSKDKTQPLMVPLTDTVNAPYIKR
jgi:phospholipid/cholesterol/gamma-HCH transport system substrate-binding protein